MIQAEDKSIQTTMSQGTVDNFVTVVSVGTREKQEIKENINFDSSSLGYVTVLTIGDDENKKNIKDVTEEVIVYRLPGERLGFGLKFEGGTKASEFVKRLFIQSCAADSPASRVKSSWGKLTEGDEVLEIDSVPVNTMTRIDCVRCLKDSNVAIKLLVRHTYEYEGKNKTEVPPLVICAEEKRVAPPPPPVPPRKISRKLLKTVNGNISKESDSVDSRVVESNKQKKLQSPRGSIRSYNSPDVSRRDRRFSDGSLGPPDAEVYVDLFLQESTQSLSESDDTGSTISTVIDRFGSFPTTTTSSFSGSLPSTPTAVQRQLDISNINIYDDEDSMFITKGLGKCIPLPREENNNIVLDDINPLCFQDAPLSYGNESTKIIIPDEIDNVKVEPIVSEESKQVLKKPPVPPRSKDTHLTTEKNEEIKKSVENLPRLVDFVPKSANGTKESENSKEIMNIFLENERYKTDFDYYDMENDNVDNFTNGVDLYSSKWSLSSQLATIGEVEEEGSPDFNFNRTASKPTPVVIVENTDKNEEKEKTDDEDVQLKNKGTDGSMATLPSDSRQPPDGHEFPDFIENHNESTNHNYYSEKEMHTSTFNADFSKPPPDNLSLEELPKKTDILSKQPVSNSNSDLRPKIYESTEDLFIPKSNLLHTRSQSLIDVSALAKQKNTKWNQMFEQRRKGLSKLKGLVIPEAVESDFSSNVNIPEIKSQTTTPALYLPVPKLDSSFHSSDMLSSSHTDLLKSSIVIPSWSSNSPSNLPKYSPAFKRKSLQVYPTSISKSENSDFVTNVDFPKYCDKGSPKGIKINDDDLNPPKSLESISSPTRSDCSFDYVSSTKKNSKSGNDSLQKSSSGKIEDESDNDSAVSSSQSSYNSRYSPPSSPTRSCELNHYSKKIEEDEKSSQNRLLKPSSVEAINRKNILASAKCRSGKDIKIGSPVIRRKQEESQQTAENEVHQNGHEKEEEPITEPVLSLKPPKVPIPLERTLPVGRSSEEKPKDMFKMKDTHTTKEVVTKPTTDILDTGISTPPPTKVVTKNICLSLNSSTATPNAIKKSAEVIDNKPRDLFSTNSRSRKPAPINVKALKQSFENLNSPPPMPHKVPVFKPTVPRRNSKTDNAIVETKVTPVSNGVSRDHKEEKVNVSLPTPQKRKSLNKSLDIETKTVVLKTDSEGTSLGISLAGGIDENKDISIHRIRYGSIAYNDGRLKKGDKIVSVNGKSTAPLTHPEAVDLLKEHVSEFTIVIEEGSDLVPSPVSSRNSSLSRRSSSMSVLSDPKSPTPEAVEIKKANTVISIIKDGAGLGFSIEGGKDSPQGDVPLLVKKIFTGGAADKSGDLKVGDQIIKMNDIQFTGLTRIEAWNSMKKITDGKVDIHIYR